MDAVIDTRASRVKKGVWRLVDPKITLASAAGLFLGTAAAAREGAVAWGWLALTWLGIFALEAAKNASGEVFDDDSGTDRRVAEEDRSPFSGGKRVIVDGLLTRRETWIVAIVCYAIGTAAGLAIVLAREPAVLWIGAAGVALAFFYHAPPLALSYRGLGELAVATVYGPLIACGAYLVQRGEIPWSIVLLSAPLGVMIAAFLWVNEFPDYKADLASGKRTLVVRLGRARAAEVFAVLVTLALYIQAAVPLVSGLPLTLWIGLAAAIPALAAARRLLVDPERVANILPAQQRTLLAFVLLSLGSGIGLLLG